MSRRVALCVLWLVLPFAGVAVAADKPKAAKNDDYYELYKVLVDTMDQVERNYVKEVDRRELVEAAIRGVLDKLDPVFELHPARGDRPLPQRAWKASSAASASR